MPYCKYCGAEQDADALFCTECGKRLKRDAPQRVTEKAESITNSVSIEEKLGLVDSAEREERIKDFYDRRMNYVLALSAFKTVVKRNPGRFEKQSWFLIESALAEKYNFPEDSILRMDFPEELNAYFKTDTASE